MSNVASKKCEFDGCEKVYCNYLQLASIYLLSYMRTSMVHSILMCIYTTSNTHSVRTLCLGV
jgi:hypothetical protein